MDTTECSKFKLVTVKKLVNSRTRQCAIYIVYYKDGVKCNKLVTNPTLKFWSTSLDKVDQYAGSTVMVIPDSDVDEVEVPFSQVYDAIVDLQAEFDPDGAKTNRAYLSECRRAGKIPANLMMCNHIHGADIDIVDSYIERFIRSTGANESNADKSVKLNKAYFDIETDNRKVRKFMEAEEAGTPVNAISFFDSKSSTLVLRLLDDSDPTECVEPNPLIAKFKAHLEEHRSSLEAYWNSMQDSIFGEGHSLPRIKVVIKFYSSEVKMIEEHYRDINHEFDPDYLMAFNQGFDHTFLMNRLAKRTGTDHMLEVVSADSIPKDYRTCFYISDRGAADINKRNDRYCLSTNYGILDSQYVYFKIRESMKKPEEFSLDYLLRKEVGITKTEHTNIDMADFPYENFELFVKYSGTDTLGLYWEDTKTSDADTMIMLGTLSRTRTEKCLSKTIMLRNLIACFFRDNSHLIVGNNTVRALSAYTSAYEAQYGRKPDMEPELAKFRAMLSESSPSLVNPIIEASGADEDDEDEVDEESMVQKAESKKVKFRGAYVAPLDKVAPAGVDVLKRASSLIFDLVVDLDLASLYPSIMVAWNIFVSTMVGKIFPAKNVEDINFSATLSDFIVSRDNLEIGKKYYSLMGKSEMFNRFKLYHGRKYGKTDREV